MSTFFLGGHTDPEMVPEEVLAHVFYALYHKIVVETERAAFARISPDSARSIAQAMRVSAITYVQVGLTIFPWWVKFLETWNSYQNDTDKINFSGDFEIF